MSMNYTGHRPPKKNQAGRILGLGCLALLVLVILIAVVAAAVSDTDTKHKPHKTKTKPRKITISTAPANRPPIRTTPITKACEKAVYGLLKSSIKTGKTPAVRPAPCDGLTDAQWSTVVGAQSKKLAADQPDPPLTDFGPGTYLVGEDIASGTYKTKGPQDDGSSAMCFWSRNKNDSGEFDAIIANEIVKGQGRVTVRKGETFVTSECQNWILVK